MAKPGPKPKLTRADSLRIEALIAQGCSDAQIAQIYGVHRTTIQRYRVSLPEYSEPEPGTLAAMIAKHRREVAEAGLS